MTENDAGENVIKKGKQDWMTYQQRLNQSQEEREANQKRNDEIAKKKLEKIEKGEEKKDTKNKIVSPPSVGGFNLG